MEVREQIFDIAAKLDALLRIRYPSENDVASRSSLCARYLANELRRWRPRLKPTATLDEAVAQADGLSDADLAVVRNRCLFYGCDDLIALLVGRRIKGDAIAREEAVLYVQDRLQRDDFRRIRAFEKNRGAGFVTYMWQVINNLLLDYLRAHGKRSQRELTDSDYESAVESEAAGFASDDLGRPQTEAESLAEAAQLRAMLADTLDAPDQRSHPRHARLREHLDLSSKERVLLKAMFQYDMTIAEISALPEFEMTAAETYRLYYKVMDRLMEAFKQAGLSDALRGLVSNVTPRVVVAIGGAEMQVSVGRIYSLCQAARNTDCHLRWRGRMHDGAIADSFAKLCKRLAAFFTPIDATTALADNVLAATYKQWHATGQLQIDGIDRVFHIGVRFLSRLKSRFGDRHSEITPEVTRITAIETGGVEQ